MEEEEVRGFANLLVIKSGPVNLWIKYDKPQQQGGNSGFK